MKLHLSTLCAAILLILITSTDAIAQPVNTSLKFQNKTRKFIVYTPQDFQLGESLPLVINMHPFLGTGAGQMNYTKYNRLADTARCIVVYPYGIQGRWISGNFFGVPSQIDDVGFIGRLIDYMDLLYNIDNSKVYATGYSAGGFMSYKLACDLTNRIAAIAPVAASMNPDGNFDTCDPDRPIPVMPYNSINDQITRYNGFTSVAPVDDVIALWQSLNGCDPEPIETPVPNIVQNDGSTVVQITYTNCDASSELIFMKFFGAGHTWPGANETFIIGNTNQDVNATNDSWAFFKRHAIPEEVVCSPPSGLSDDVQDGELLLNWDPVEGVSSYNVFIELPDGERVFLENINGTSASVDVTAEGPLQWAVRSNCSSGHASWSDISMSEITLRMASSELTVYPNPAQDVLFINHNEATNTGQRKYKIYDLFGNMVLKSQLSGDNYLDISLLSEGWYTLIHPKDNLRQQFYKF